MERRAIGIPMPLPKSLLRPGKLMLFLVSACRADCADNYTAFKLNNAVADTELFFFGRLCERDFEARWQFRWGCNECKFVSKQENHRPQI